MAWDNTCSDALSMVPGTGSSIHRSDYHNYEQAGKYISSSVAVAALYRLPPRDGQEERKSVLIPGDKELWRGEGALSFLGFAADGSAGDVVGIAHRGGQLSAGHGGEHWGSHYTAIAPRGADISLSG